MRAWDIYTGNLYGPHPCVLVSCQARIDFKPQVVVLKCTSLKPGQEREARDNEAVLDQEDGLNWKTLCRCDLLFTVDRDSAFGRRQRAEQLVEMNFRAWA